MRCGLSGRTLEHFRELAEVFDELALEFIEEDELIEVTPDGIRLRKRVLDAIQRKKAAKAANQSA